MQYLESKIEVDTLKQFKEHTYTSENKCLYDLWMQFKDDDILLHDYFDNDSENQLDLDCKKNPQIEEKFIDCAAENIILEEIKLDNEFDFPEFDHLAFNENSCLLDQTTEILIDQEIANQEKL